MLLFTNSLWEIQKVKPFRGGSIIWDEYYRFKHIGTGKYLAVAADKLELTLKDFADSSDTLFTLRQDTFKPNSSLRHPDPVHTGDHVILETAHRTYLQICKELEDEEHQAFEHKAQSHFHKYQSDQGKSKVPGVCGIFSRDDVSKMVFTIEELPYEKALIAYQASSFFTSFVAFFDFLNSWAVIKTDEEEDTLDVFRYDYQAAMATD